MRRLMTGYGLTVFGLTLLLAAIVALNGLGHFYTDIKPEVYLAPGRMIGQYLSAWTSTPYLGSANFNVGLVPVLLVTGALRGIGMSPEWAYKLLHFVLWLVTAWGTARLTRRLIRRGTDGTAKSGENWAGLAAGVLVLANPYTIQAGSTLAIALPMALLPWSLLAFIRALWQPVDRWFSWRGWLWPAVFGMLFFAMSGMNVAVVPLFQLLGLLPIIWVARSVWRLRWSVVFGTLGKCAAFVIGLSAYWLVPGMGAVTTGSQIVDESESLTGIAKVASFPEVLRGMGLWSLYGQDNHGAWVPQDAVFLTSPLVMTLTMLWPALALLAMRWLPPAARVIVAATIGVAAVVMVGMFPAAGHPSSPFGVVFRWLIGLPGMGAFRTSNKAGALLALGLAIALGVAATALGPRVLRRAGVAPIAGAAVAMLLLSWTLPALTNRLYTSPMDIPSYWQQAASSINKGNQDAAVLFLPGQTRAAYRWTVDRPDDVANSLFSRQVILPETSPNASPPGGNFLASLDSTLENGIVPDGMVSTYARYLGADTVLLRHDTDWEDPGGVRPIAADAIAKQDNGLREVAGYGYPGEYVTGPLTGGVSGEEQLPPLQRYAVAHPNTGVRVEPTSNSLVVAGDGWSVPAMVDAGLLGGAPSFRYAQDLSAAQLANSLGGDHALVLTDTNARRDAVANRLANNQGPLLSANQPLGVSRTLGNNPDDQTVLERSGAQVTATSEGGAFFDLPYAVPENAVDGDPSTAWLFGDFDRAVGNRLTITEPQAITPGTVRIAQTEGGGVRLDRVTVRAGDKSVTRSLPTSGYADFPLGTTTAQTITVTVDSTRGTGYNLVGIRDIQLPGAPAVRTARTPLTFGRLYQQLTSSGRAAFDRTPLDVLLTREQGTADPADDSETGLRRLVSLPDARTFGATAAVRVDGSLEAAYDQLAGLSPSVVASSSDFYFRLQSTRASLAADGRPATAWQPGGELTGAWWQLAGPDRPVSAVSVTQRPGDGAAANPRDAYAKAVTISVDGKNVTTATLKQNGTTRIGIPKVNGKPLRGKVIRMTVNSVTGPTNGVPPRFTSIDTGLLVHQQQLGPISRAGATDPRCLTVATVDGRPVRMRPTTDHLAGPANQGTDWTSCGTLRIGAGQHRIEPVTGFTLDNLHLTDTQRPAATAALAAAPVSRLSASSSTHKSLHVTTQGPSAVILGQSIAPGWHATANGKDLGAPQLIDGYSSGWLLPTAGHYDVEIRYAPQLRANLALGVSLAVLLFAVAVGAFAVFRKLRPEDSHPDDADRAPERAIGIPQAAPARLTTAVAPLFLPRQAIELGLVLTAGFFVGWSGLVAAVAVVAALRWRSIPAWVLQLAGAALLIAAMGVYLLVLGDQRGMLTADGVARSMWPHWLAGAGLVVGLVGVLRMHGDEEETPGDA